MTPKSLSAVVERSGIVEEALSEARRAHAGQVRHTGNGEMPFIDHPVAVAELLAADGRPDEVVAAGLLHDVVENSETELDQLREHFGSPVARLVAALSEDDAIASYRERKDEHRGRVAEAGADACAIFAADKLANVRVLRAAYAVRGEDADREMRVPMDTKMSTWRRDLEMLREAEPGQPLVTELAEELAALEGERSRAAASP